MGISLPTISQAKAQAKRLRADLAPDQNISHSKSLELVAGQYGYKDWNTLFAAIGNDSSINLSLGARVTGQYLGQSFAGTIVSVTFVQKGWHRLTIDLDEPVDVVTFDSFSNFRNRIRGMIGPSGVSQEKTSNGKPHLMIDL